MKSGRISLFICALIVLGPYSVAEPSNSPSLLPKAFGGWQMAGAPQISANPAAADPANPDLLKEYGFTDFEGAVYTRDDGRKLTVKAARFGDTSGAYGAFTYYKLPQMLNEKIGDQGSSLNERILFYRGNVLVDAVFQRLSAMSAAELRELADDLPHPSGPTANLPGLPIYLPKQSYVKNTAKYVVGPLALAAVGAPLPPQFVDFSKGAEVVLGDYDLSGERARLMLISYPTPQIAATQLKRIESALQAHELGDSNIAFKRTGPILAMVSGRASNGDTKSLLAQINYDADVTWNEKTYFTRRDNVANLIVGIIILAAIVCGLSVVAGIAFGGFRMVVKRFFPGRVFDRPEQMEIIALHLSDEPGKPGNPTVSSSIKTG
jgi:hypothetical protein